MPVGTPSHLKAARVARAAAAYPPPALLFSFPGARSINLSQDPPTALLFPVPGARSLVSLGYTHSRREARFSGAQTKGVHQTAASLLPAEFAARGPRGTVTPHTGSAFFPS